MSIQDGKKRMKRLVLLSLAFIITSFTGMTELKVASAAGGEGKQQSAYVTTSESVRTSMEALQDWKKWTTDHAYSLSSIQPETAVNGKIPADRFKDLEMLKPLLHDKRIVFLGESSHGVAEFNLAKTRLIQFLHEEMGYNVLAFESGISNSMNVQGKISHLSAEQAMKGSIFGVWWAQETLPLFDYIKTTRNTDQPLLLAGFDIQQQGQFIDTSWLKDEKMAKQLAEAEKQLMNWGGSKDLKGYQKAKSGLIQTYEQVLSQVKQKESALRTAYPDEPQIVKLIERALKERIRVVKEYVEINIKSNIEMENYDPTSFLKSMEWRDQAMLANLIWLATEVYPNEKFIVWGHNDHIRKSHSEVQGSPYPVKLMGELLPVEFKKYSYVLGLYMASGETADNMRNPMSVLPVKSGSIEDLLESKQSPYTFIDMRYRQNERGSSWMFEPRFAYSWGFMEESFVPRDQYDGLLLINKVKAPTYIK
ncbi:erythromycin esterase family protein [Cytobacillus solani]|nr:erythromycin esterase family protein [Cytobacillus solani]